MKQHNYFSFTWSLFYILKNQSQCLLKIDPSACCFTFTCFSSLLQSILWRNKAGYCCCGNLRWFLTVTGLVKGYLCIKAGNLHTLKITSWFLMRERKARRITGIFLHISRFAHYCTSSLSAPLRMTVALVRTKLLRVLAVFKQQPVKEEPAHCLFLHLPFHVPWDKVSLLCIMALSDVYFLSLTNAKGIIMATLSITSMRVCRRKKQAINNVVYFCSK